MISDDEIKFGLILCNMIWCDVILWYDLCWYARVHLNWLQFIFVSFALFWFVLICIVLLPTRSICFGLISFCLIICKLILLLIWIDSFQICLTCFSLVWCDWLCFTFNWIILLFLDFRWSFSDSCDLKCRNLIPFDFG